MGSWVNFNHYEAFYSLGRVLIAAISFGHQSSARQVIKVALQAESFGRAITKMGRPSGLISYFCGENLSIFIYYFFIANGSLEETFSSLLFELNFLSEQITRREISFRRQRAMKWIRYMLYQSGMLSAAGNLKRLKKQQFVFLI